MSLLINLEDVSVKLGEQTILSQITMSLYPGRMLTLVGPNGAGKSTLVKVVLGLILPTTGSVTRRDNLQVGYIPQKIVIDPTLPLTVLRFLLLDKGGRLQKIERALARVGASGLVHASMHTLSGGEIQRVLLARALLNTPQLLVLDEPAQGVDMNGQLMFYDLIGQLRDELNCSVLMVSHDLHLVMAKTDEVICLNKHICCSGPPEAVSKHSAFTALFGTYGTNLLAIYRHHHNHCHDLHGQTIVSSQQEPE